MTAISNGITTVTPILWMDYTSTREANTRSHQLVSGRAAITLHPAGPRRVSVVLLFADETESKACEDMHAQPGIITITEDDRPTHSMQYVVVGKITRELDSETQDAWIVTAEAEEVGT